MKETINTLSAIGEKTWVSLGLLISLMGGAIGGTIFVTNALNQYSRAQWDQSNELETLKSSFNQGLEHIKDELVVRTKLRWTAGMEAESWAEFERKNRDKGLIIPDVRTIKKEQE